MCVINRGDLINCQSNTGEELNYEQHEHNATRGGERVKDSVFASNYPAAIPTGRDSDISHARLMRSAALFSNDWYCTCSFPFSIREGKGSRPRRAGPVSREPSAAK